MLFWTQKGDLENLIILWLAVLKNCKQPLNSVLSVKAVVAAFNQEKALVGALGAFSVITNFHVDLRLKLYCEGRRWLRHHTSHRHIHPQLCCHVCHGPAKTPFIRERAGAIVAVSGVQQGQPCSCRCRTELWLMHNSYKPPVSHTAQLHTDTRRMLRLQILTYWHSFV